MTIIGGYLGAGKTTAINHLLRTTTERVAVMVNDFGSLNIDADLIESEDEDMIALSNGCICCSLVDGFGQALADLTALPDAPKRLVVEASGVAQLDRFSAYGYTPGYHLDGVVVLADSETIEARSTDRFVGDTVLNQLSAADIIVLTKTDLVSQTADTVAWLSRVAPATPVVEVSQGRVPLDVLFDRRDLTGRGASDRAPAPGSSDTSVAAPDVTVAAGHDVDDIFDTATWLLAGPIDDEELAQLVANRPEGVVRMKGIVQRQSCPDDRTVVQVVGQRASIATEGRWVEGQSGRLVAIGTKGSLKRWQPLESGASRH